MLEWHHRLRCFRPHMHSFVVDEYTDPAIERIGNFHVISYTRGNRHILRSCALNDVLTIEITEVLGFIGSHSTRVTLRRSNIPRPIFLPLPCDSPSTSRRTHAGGPPM